MLRAVPSTMRTAASMSCALRSFILTSAIFFTSSREIVPTFSRFCARLPFSRPAAFLSRSDAGGVFSTNENERSSYTVISAGMMLPAWFAVFSLYSLQKPMMLMPCWPSAGPTGGAGFAFPAEICNVMTARIFFAISFAPPGVRARCGRTAVRPYTLSGGSSPPAGAAGCTPATTGRPA